MPLFLPDGSLLTGSPVEGLARWDLTDPANPVGLRVSEAGEGARSLALSPDGRTLALSGPGGMSLWEVSYPAYPVLLTFWSDASRLSFAPDGHTLVVSGAGAGLWDFSWLDDLRADLAGHACALAGRGLDETEWARLLPAIPYEATCG